MKGYLSDWVPFLFGSRKKGGFEFDIMTKFHYLCSREEYS